MADVLEEGGVGCAFAWVDSTSAMAGLDKFVGLA